MKHSLYWAAGLSLALAGSPGLAAQVDVLIFYTDEAAGTSAGQDMDARIASYVEHANQAYRNSDMDIELRLVGTERIDGNYRHVDGGVLGNFRMDRNVARLRQETGADLVTLINMPQATAGGYVCGVGYQPGGSASNGSFYSNASAYAFSLVGVSCGYNTFAHELGHNMSLGHSHVQNSEGAVFPWGRGHGVSGLFSTVMAYPQAYGTRNHLQQFSSPDQVRCEGQPCGSAIGRGDGADAVAAVNQLAVQIADFMPTAVIDNGNDDSDGEDPSTGDPDLPVCDKPDLAEDNLLEGVDFNDLSPWSSFNNAANLSSTAITTDCGLDNLLQVTERSEYYGGPVQTIAGGLEPGAEYRVTAKLGLTGTDGRDAVRVSLELTDSQGTRYQNLPELSVTASELSRYDQTFTVTSEGNLSSARLIIGGPDAGTDFLADEIRLVKVKDAPNPDDGSDGGDPGNGNGDDDNPGNDNPDNGDGDQGENPDNGDGTLLINETFENGGTGWSGYMGAWVFRSRTASEGNYGLASLVRLGWYSGPALEATGLIESGQSYQASVDVLLRNSRLASDKAQLWAWYVDDTGAHWQQLGGEEVATGNWVTVNSRFVLQSSGLISQLRLHIMGPDPSTRIVIDNFKLGL